MFLNTEKGSRENSLIAPLVAVLTGTNKYICSEVFGVAFHPKGKQVLYLTTGNGVSEQVKVTTNFRCKNGETNRILQTAQAIVLGAEAPKYLANGKISGCRCN